MDIDPKRPVPWMNRRLSLDGERGDEYTIPVVVHVATCLEHARRKV
jgi:hypothetical protein